MACRKPVEPSEHAPPAARIGGKVFRGAGAPTKGLRHSRLPVGPDGYLVVPDEIIDMRSRALSTRPLPPDPYSGEA